MAEISIFLRNNKYVLLIRIPLQLVLTFLQALSRARDAHKNKCVKTATRFTNRPVDADVIKFLGNLVTWQFCDPPFRSRLAIVVSLTNCSTLNASSC